MRALKHQAAASHFFGVGLAVGGSPDLWASRLWQALGWVRSEYLPQVTLWCFNLGCQKMRTLISSWLFTQVWRDPQIPPSTGQREPRAVTTQFPFPWCWGGLMLPAKVRPEDKIK